MPILLKVIRNVPLTVDLASRVACSSTRTDLDRRALSFMLHVLRSPLPEPTSGVLVVEDKVQNQVKRYAENDRAGLCRSRVASHFLEFACLPARRSLSNTYCGCVWLAR